MWPRQRRFDSWCGHVFEASWLCDSLNDIEKLKRTMLALPVLLCVGCIFWRGPSLVLVVSVLNNYAGGVNFSACVFYVRLLVSSYRVLSRVLWSPRARLPVPRSCLGVIISSDISIAISNLQPRSSVFHPQSSQSPIVNPSYL